MTERGLLGAVGAFCVLAVDLVMGLPVYGLVGTLADGRDPLASDGGLGQLVRVAGCGAPFAAAAALFWLWLVRSAR